MPIESSLIGAVALLAIAMLVAIGARRLRLPYTVGLVVVGAILAITQVAPPLTLTHDLIVSVLLPPLLFEAALAIPWRELRVDAVPIIVLAIVGTCLSAAVTTAGMMAFIGWPLRSALVFGVLIAATDPVAVIAMFKDGDVHGRVRLLVETESLLNDGVAAVLFSVALVFAHGGPAAMSGWDAVLALAVSTGGGLIVGASVGAVATLIAGRTDERPIEAALTVVAAYGAFVLAESLHVSGVLSVVAAGLFMGNLGVLRDDERGPLSTGGRAFVVDFWDFAAFVSNSVIFPLIGISVASLHFSRGDLLMLPVAIGVVLASRALAVYPLCLPLLRSRWSLSWPEQHVLFWGGLRGALALALALTLPPDLPYRGPILVAAFGVVAFSIVVQGLTMPIVLRLLRIGQADRDGSVPKP